jgi:hypothetical protein
VIQESGNQSSDLTIGESNDCHISGGNIDECERLALTGHSLALPLEIHGVSSSRGANGLGTEETVGFIAASLVQFAGWAIREESTGITTQVGPEITFCESFRDLSVSQVEHAVVGETNQRLSSLGWDEYAEIL